MHFYTVQNLLESFDEICYNDGPSKSSTGNGLNRTIWQSFIIKSHISKKSPKKQLASLIICQEKSLGDSISILYSNGKNFIWVDCCFESPPI